jgi:putative ABC transport system permease protein
MALMLSMGAGRLRLFMMLFLEGIFLSLAGFFLGIFISRLGVVILSNQLNKNYHYSLNEFSIQQEEIFLLIAALLVGIFAAVIPSLGVYKIDISKTLAED